MDNFSNKNSSDSDTHSSNNVALDNMVANHYKQQKTFSQNSFGKSVFAIFFGGLAVWFLDSVQVIVIALGVFIIFHLFIVSPHTIEGPSMEPNFYTGQLLLTNRLVQWLGSTSIGESLGMNYNRGDVVTLQKPGYK